MPAPAAPIYGVALAYTMYVVAVGGDFMPFFRFLVPVMPLYCLLLAWTLRRLLLRPLGVTLAVQLFVVGLWGFQLVCSLLTEQPYRAFVAHRTAVVGRAVGEWLAQRLSPDDLVAVNTAGSVPYCSNLPALDTLGLTDAQIARRPIYIVSTGWAGHRRGWGAYVLARRPQVILWYNSTGSREPFYLGDHELAESAVFSWSARGAQTCPP